MLSLATVGCGGNSSSTSSDANPSASATAWRAQTQAICRDARVAIDRLGDVHITYAGIAQIGLPAAKATVETYLGRLLGILRTHAAQQQSLDPPPELSSTVASARRLERQEQDVTVALKAAVARANSSRQFAAAFREWVQHLNQLAVQGNAVARRLGLPDCMTSA